MTVERGPEDQRSIVVRSEQSSFEQVVRNPLLEGVGFSTQLANQLMRLNDVIVRSGAAPPLGKVGIAMVPGKIPIITTDVSHDSGMRIFIESGGGVASLKLDTSMPYASPLTVKIEDIQDFVKALFPDKEAKVFSEVHDDVKEEAEDLDIDLYQINNETLKTFLEFLKGKEIRMLYSRFEVRVSDQNLPKRAHCLFAFHLMARANYPDRVGCRIAEFNYQGRPKEVEEVMDKLTILLDKNPMYPFMEEHEKPVSNP